METNRKLLGIFGRDMAAVWNGIVEREKKRELGDFLMGHLTRFWDQLYIKDWEQKVVKKVTASVPIWVNYWMVEIFLGSPWG